MSQASSFIDASVVYGPSSLLMASLREGEGQGGRLKMSLSPDGRELLPVSEDMMDGCNRYEMSQRGRYCFKSGQSPGDQEI